VISDWELWARASQVLQQHADRTDEHIASRVAELALAGDEEGVSAWKAIALRVDTLRDSLGEGAAIH
jgi:hypothetical protein